MHGKGAYALHKFGLDHPGPRHSPEWYDQRDEPVVLEEGDRIFVPCEGGPAQSRLEIYPPRLEVEERDGVYVLLDDGPRAEWRYLFVPRDPAQGPGAMPDADDPTTGGPAATDEDAVLRANQAFYDAHEARDLEAMARVWDHGDVVTCIHPGWPILRGWDEVEGSWRRIFAGAGRNQFIVTNDVVVVDGDLAWVTLDENLVDRAVTGTIAATNLFARRSTGWLLVLHHGSPVQS